MAEICNGFDDNCDGSSDEGFGTISCGIGACYTEIDECIEGVPQVCVPLDPGVEVCEARDRKGLYAKARKGIIPEFTGISDPYEAPEHPEIVIDTSELSPAQSAQAVLLYLFKEGYLDDSV